MCMVSQPVVDIWINVHIRNILQIPQHGKVPNPNSRLCGFSHSVVS